MNPGDLCWNDYGEAPACVHARILGAPIQLNQWAIITPDHDVYPEQEDHMNPDLVGFYYGGANHLDPPGVAPNRLYRFAPMAPGVVNNLMVQARVVANAERAALGLPPLDAGGGAPPPPAPLPLPAPPAGAADTYVAVEDEAPFQRGDVVVGAGMALPAGSIHAVVAGGQLPKWALVPVPSGEMVPVKLVTAAEVNSLRRGDLRTLPIYFDAQGDRRREFNSAVALLSMDVLPGGNIPLEGPRTALELAKAARSRGHTFVTDLEKWISVTDLHPGDRSLYEAEVLVEALDAFMTIDQVNIANLMGFEILVRRYQLIKEAHRISPQNPDYSAADVFMGWGSRRHGIMPALNAFVSKELNAQYTVAKEARKAREEAWERNNSRSKGAKGRKGKGGAKGSDAAADA